VGALRKPRPPAIPLRDLRNLYSFTMGRRQIPLRLVVFCCVIQENHTSADGFPPFSSLNPRLFQITCRSLWLFYSTPLLCFQQLAPSYFPPNHPGGGGTQGISRFDSTTRTPSMRQLQAHLCACQFRKAGFFGVILRRQAFCSAPLDRFFLFLVPSSIYYLFGMITIAIKCCIKKTPQHFFNYLLGMNTYATNRGGGGGPSRRAPSLAGRKYFRFL